MNDEMVSKHKVATFLAELFDSPCNFTPLNAEMWDYCDECQYPVSNGYVECWERVIDKKLKDMEVKEYPDE